MFVKRRISYMEHYLVKAQFGHVGRNNFIIKTVPIYAEDGRRAAYIVRWMGRVKHNRKDAIIAVEKCSEETYLEQKEANAKDPYFFVHSKQEQKALCNDLDNQIISYVNVAKNNKKERTERVKYKMKKNKIMKKEAACRMKNYEASMNH